MADRTITVRMRAEHKQAVNAMNEVGSSAERAAGKIEGSGRSADGAFSKMAKNAAENERAWTAAGGVLTGVGAGIIAMGVAATKTGVEFNSLKQTSGAALKTVLGSAEAAGKQMDKLNSFGDKSWVMRDVLIRAQQQMTGFGVETQKVIPYLDGLQEAVAAAGGSSQTFEELAGVMAKVKSQGKITAETFNEFGSRGVDAATIIGEQMGKTGQEIRDSVTDGSLDADKALDALASGMKTKFDGATENLRNTFRGAMDNLAAAWRNLSSEMASPIVDPDGGGLAVSGLNAIADAMANVTNVAKGIPAPVKATGLAVGGLVGVASLAAGGFLLLAPRLVETQKAFATLAGQDDLVGKTARGLGAMKTPLANIAKAGATVAVLGAIAVQIGKISESSGLKEAEDATRGLGRALEEIKGSSDALDGLFQNSSGEALTSDIDSLGAALDRTFNKSWQDKFNDWGEGILQPITGLRGESGLLEDQWAALDDELAKMVEGGNASGAAAAFEEIKKQAADQGYSVEQLVTLLPGYKGAVEDAGVASSGAAGGVGELSGEAVAAKEHLEEVRQSLLESGAGFVDFTAKAKGSKATLQEWIKDLEEQVKAQSEWFDNLGTLAERGVPQALLDELMAMGPEGAKIVKDMANSSDEDLKRLTGSFQTLGKQARDYAEDATSIPKVDLDADGTKLKKQVDKAKERLDELRKLPTTPEIDAQITLLEEQVKAGRAKLKELDKEKANPTISADSEEAKKQIREAVKKMEEADGKEANMFVRIWRSITGDNESGAAKKSGKGRKGVENRAKMLKDPFAYASGGSISGPGTGTSDSIPAMLSNGEHVWTAEEVRKAGGHSVVEMMRQAAKSGVMGFAKGGAVGSAERRVDAAGVNLKSARRRKQDAKSKAAKATASRAVRAAEDELDAARKSLRAAKSKATADAKAARLANQKAKEAKREADRRAKEAKREAERKAKEERERRARVSDMRSDLRVDVRRGNITDQVTGGLSGGYSAVDRLSGLGANKDLSKASRSKANSGARRFEANLKALYSQADKIDEKLKAAQDKATELKGIKDSVVSGLLGGRELDVGTFQTQANGQWSSHSNLGQAAKGLSMDVGAMKAFAGKLKKLTELGVPGSIIQEIAQAGVSEGSNMADSFIDATAAERKSYLGAWSDYEKYANQAGQYVTEGFQAGGASAADGVVKGLEGKKKSVEKAIANLAKAMESTFKSVLGIHSPSRVMSELGGFTAEGLVQGMLGGTAGVQSAADALANAAVPTSMAFDVGVSPVVEDDEGAAALAMQDMSTVTLESMALMQQGVSDGWAAMLFNTQEMQAGLLLGTQTNNAAMSLNTSETMAAMLLNLQTQQSAMLLDMQTKQASMLLGTQTQYEAMRSTAEQKQIAQKTVMTDQQEAMRLMLIDKQASMLLRSSTDFESMKTTTGTKFSDMRKSTDGTMSDMYTDYSTRLGSLKGLNERGFESILATSNTNMRGVREGIDGQLRDAKPELGNRMNALISVLSSFTDSVNKAFGDVGVKLKSPKPLKFATGGVMPGYTPGRDVHQFSSPTAGELYLSGGEAIMRPEFTRAVGGEQGVKELNKAARNGGDNVHHLLSGQGFASGGVLGRVPGVNAFADSGVWRNLWAITKAQFPSAQLTSAYRGGAITASGNTSHHSRGNAIDVSPSMDIFNFWRNKYGANLAELIYSPANGKQIKNGSNYTYKGAVRGMHFSHVHIAAVRALSDAMAGGLPGMGGEMSHPFLDRAKVKPGDDLEKSYGAAAKKLLTGIVGKHTGMLPDGIGEQLGEGIMAQASNGLVGKAKKYGKNAGAGDFGNVASGPVKNMAKQMLEQMGWGDQFGTLDWLLTRESGWRPTAQNPSSSAYGLFQFLNGTWGTVGGSKTSDPKKQLEYGLKYIQQRYGDVNGAKAFWERNHWYESGTESAQSGWAVVGEDGPEAIQLNGGEKIKTSKETRKLLAENRTFIPNNRSGFDSAALSDAMSAAIQSNGINANDLANALNGVKLTFQADGHQFTGAVTAVIGNGYDESRSRLSKSSQKIGAR